jgi:hypothetical protein
LSTNGLAAAAAAAMSCEERTDEPFFVSWTDGRLVKDRNRNVNVSSNRRFFGRFFSVKKSFLRAIIFCLVLVINVPAKEEQKTV